jgi:hypothetical protein
VTTPASLPPFRSLRWLILGLLAALVVLSLNGCATKRTETATETKHEKSVTKTDEHHSVNIVFDVPNYGPMPVTGSYVITTYSETLTDSEAKEDRESKTQADLAAIGEQMRQMAALVAKGVGQGGGILGGIASVVADPTGFTIISSLLAALGLGGAKKVVDHKRDRKGREDAEREAAEAKATAKAEAERRARAEADADEGWNKLAEHAKPTT